MPSQYRIHSPRPVPAATSARLVSFGRRTGIQGDDFIRCEEKDAMGGCFEIIEESYLGNGESLGEGSPR